MTAIEVLKYLLNKADSEIPEGHWLVELSVPIDIVREIVDAQPEEDCDTCKYGSFGSRQCDNCRVGYPSHYTAEQI